jgi:hypothetical protein
MAHLLYGCFDRGFFSFCFVNVRFSHYLVSKNILNFVTIDEVHDISSCLVGRSFLILLRLSSSMYNTIGSSRWYGTANAYSSTGRRPNKHRKAQPHTSARMCAFFLSSYLRREGREERDRENSCCPFALCTHITSRTILCAILATESCIPSSRGRSNATLLSWSLCDSVQSVSLVETFYFAQPTKSYRVYATHSTSKMYT